MKNRFFPLHFRAQGILAPAITALMLAIATAPPCRSEDNTGAATDGYSAKEIIRRVLKERQGEPYHIAAKIYPLGVSPRNVQGRSMAAIPLDIYNLWQPDRVRTLYRISPPGRPTMDLMVDHNLVLDSWQAFVRGADGGFLPIREEHLATRFANLDFTFEDLAFTFLLWPSHTLEGITRSKGRPCYIIESFPGPEQVSQYSSVRSWIDQEGWFPLRLECYSREDPDTVFRQIEIISVKKEDDRWNLSKVEARDLIRRTRTRMEILEVNTGPDAVPEHVLDAPAQVSSPDPKEEGNDDLPPILSPQ
jgi:hypothetical protein